MNQISLSNLVTNPNWFKDQTNWHANGFYLLDNLEIAINCFTFITPNQLSTWYIWSK
ncbi:hypothetical protein DDB_G0291594 [Dictyostelium discoideum AX4]|uniref:Uncharacterized protein n=1 Tax=Dictyostelium discoideum TaxID=44689 RepID=Q54EB7_DICDI|nr:hypothetical protein DDB_G0291594 [Dictyostelium discoideum AX4]EAL61781.1 hypothetical protein DDB_G0291594 [Dictyostelium discoideum AX4]|eukprot:XP_635323.1 hypothetical protein DDB_G0291594 [Dictyostelium discoideum AX4]